jgi:hypothetical protein
LNAVFKEFASALYPSGVALDDLFGWLGEKEPGYLIKHFISDVDPEGLTQRQRGKAGYRGAVKMMSVGEIKNHLSSLRPEDPKVFKAKNYTTKRYLCTSRCALMGSGFKSQDSNSKSSIALRTSSYLRTSFPHDSHQQLAGSTTILLRSGTL